MSYYMGDFYRGDPGIGSFFGKVFRSVGGLVPGVGGILTKIGSVMPGGARTMTPALPAAASATGAAGAIIKKVGGAIVKHPVLSAAGAAGALGGMAGAAGEALMGGGAPHVRGMHPCKGLRPGHKPRPCKHGDMVPNRRMNPFNPRAARRASRRLHSLVRHYRKYIGFVSARKPKGRPFMKRRKK